MVWMIKSTDYFWACLNKSVDLNTIFYTDKAILSMS